MEAIDVTNDKHAGKAAAGRLGMARRWKNDEAEKRALRELHEFRKQKALEQLTDAENALAAFVGEAAE